MKMYISLVMIACLDCRTKEWTVKLNVTIKEEHVHFVELENVALKVVVIMVIVTKNKETLPLIHVYVH